MYLFHSVNLIIFLIIIILVKKNEFILTNIYMLIQKQKHFLVSDQYDKTPSTVMVLHKPHLYLETALPSGFEMS